MAARRKKTGAQVNIPMCLACVLLCLTLFSVHFSSGVVARYTTTATAHDSARVIKFGDISLTLIGGPKQYIAPGVELTWNAAVTFDGSESATYVFLEVSDVYEANATSVMPIANGPTWTVASGWSYLGKYTDTYVYYLALTPNLALPNTAMPNTSLFTSNTATVSEYLTAETLESMTSITASFRASVVQSNGFETVSDAWNSLETKH